MCQIWLNLPAKYKMNPPKYQPVKKDTIPKVPFVDATNNDNACSKLQENNYVRIIAGNYHGTKGPAG